MVAIEKVIEAFEVEGKVVDCIPFGNGHINDTRLVTMDNGVQLMRNFKITALRISAGLF